MSSENTSTHAVDMSDVVRDRAKLALSEEEVCFNIRNLDLYYAEKQALHGINMLIPKRRVTAYIGPSGCGKSTLLRCLNRMNDLVDGVRIDGDILLDDDDINAARVNVADLRRRVGMVFQKPNPNSQSIVAGKPVL